MDINNMTAEQAKEHLINVQIPSMRRLIDGMINTIRFGMATGQTDGMPKDVIAMHTSAAFCKTIEQGFELEPDPVRDTMIGILLAELAEQLGPLQAPVKSDSDASAAIDLSEL